MSDARMEVEAVFRCPQCGGTPYRMYRRSTDANPDVFTHVVWPTEPGVPPPANPTLTCPNDGTMLARSAA